MAELYRVQNANTNEQERLVSDTLYVKMPEGKPSISLEAQNEANSTDEEVTKEENSESTDNQKEPTNEVVEDLQINN